MPYYPDAMRAGVQNMSGSPEQRRDAAIICHWDSYRIDTALQPRVAELLLRQIASCCLAVHIDVPLHFWCGQSLSNRREKRQWRKKQREGVRGGAEAGRARRARGAAEEEVAADMAETIVTAIVAQVQVIMQIYMKRCQASEMKLVD